jgi:hypothetical protein
MRFRSPWRANRCGCVGVWIAQLDDETTARRHLAGAAAALEWGMQLAHELEQR